MIRKSISLIALAATSFACSDDPDPVQTAQLNNAGASSGPVTLPSSGGAGGGAAAGAASVAGAGMAAAGGDAAGSAVGGAGGSSSGGTSPAATGGTGGMMTAGAGGMMTAGAGGSVAAGGAMTGGSGGTKPAGGSAGMTAGAGGTAGTAGAATIPATPGALVGWATQGTGTTGGGDVAPVVVTSIEELNTAAAGTDAKVIHVNGKLSGTLMVGSNKTIVGLAGAEISGAPGSLRLSDSSNVIIRNLKLVGRHTDPNALLHNAKNVWLDHNEFVDGKSDLLRLTGVSDFLTISWNIFRQSKFGFEHMGVNIGEKDSAIEGIGHMNVTLHHNIYQELVNERMPRARFGKVHTFNNICLAGTDAKTRSYYAVRAGVDANVRSERNIYKDFNGASWWWTAEKLGAETSTAFNFTRDNENSVLESIEDICDNCAMGPVNITEHEGFKGTGGFYSSGTAFVPPYAYTPDPTDGLEAKVRAGAGPQ